MINYLLDTNVFLWYFEDAKRISPIKGLITSEDSAIFISVVSFWEIIIKIRTGRLKIDYDEIRNFANKYSFIELPLTSDVSKAYLDLPKIHKDPFDLMLLAQAITCPMRLITVDALLADYSSLVVVV